MLVALQDFGSIWTARTERLAAESGIRQRAFFNTTGIFAGTKLQSRSCVYGYVRLDECSGFDVAFATRVIHRVYETAGVSIWNGRNRLFLRHLTPKGTCPEMHLFRVRSCDVGWIDRKSAWQSEAAQLVSFSEGKAPCRSPCSTDRRDSRYPLAPAPRRMRPERSARSSPPSAPRLRASQPPR